MNNGNLNKIEKKIRAIKKELEQIGEMRPGSLSNQYRKSKEKYGEYWQLSYTHQGKGRTEYIRDPFVEEVKTQLSTYRRFRNLIDEWVTLAIEYARIKMNETRRLSEKN